MRNLPKAEKTTFCCSKGVIKKALVPRYAYRHQEYRKHLIGCDVEMLQPSKPCKVEEVGVLQTAAIVEVELIEGCQAGQVEGNPSGAILYLGEGHALQVLEGAQHLPKPHCICGAAAGIS